MSIRTEPHPCWVVTCDRCIRTEPHPCWVVTCDRCVRTEPHPCWVVTCDRCVRTEPHPCWVVTCDRCGEGDNSEYGGSFHHESEAAAKQALRDIDWSQALDGSWLCFDCFGEARMEQYACPHGAACNGGCGDDCPVPSTANYSGARQEPMYPKVNEGSSDAADD